MRIQLVQQDPRLAVVRLTVSTGLPRTQGSPRKCSQQSPLEVSCRLCSVLMMLMASSHNGFMELAPDWSSQLELSGPPSDTVTCIHLHGVTIALSLNITTHI